MAVQELDLEPVQPIKGYTFETKEDLVSAMDDILALGLVPLLTPYFTTVPGSDPEESVLVWRMTIATPDGSVEDQHVYLTPPLQPAMQTWLIRDDGVMRTYTQADAVLKYQPKAQ